jgi:hypothetical protein
MRSLQAGFITSLKKDRNCKKSFIVKMRGKPKAGGANVYFYFADSWDEVDGNAVDGILMDVGSIKENIDYYNNSSTFGGFDIEVMHLQDKTADIIRDYYFYNQLVNIYYWQERQARTTADLQLAYTGIVENSPSDPDRVIFRVGNYRRKLDKPFPPNIEDNDAGPADGKVAQYVYGERGIKYGKLDIDSGTGKMTNNLVKCIYCGIEGGKHRWIVGGNGADITITDFNDIWFYDMRLRRYIRLADGTGYASGTDTQGNLYVELEAQGAYIAECYDYIMPDLAYDYAGSATYDFVDTDKVLDGDWSTFSYMDMVADTFNERLVVYFPKYPTYDITEKRIYCKTRGDENIDNFLMTNFHSSALDVNTPLSSPGTEFTQTTTGTPSQVVEFSVTGASGPARAQVFYCFIRFKHKMVELNDMYVECSNSTDTQREIIEDICDYAGITYSDNASVTACTLAPVLDMQKTAYEWIKEVAKQGACTAIVRYNNNLAIMKPDITASADLTLQVADIKIDTLKCDESTLNQVVNDIRINYYKDNYTDGFSETLTDDNSTSDGIYGTREKVINADMWTATPTTLKTYHVDSTNETFFSQVRNIVSYETNGLVGVDPYTSGGDYHPLIELEIGDYFSINSEMDDYRKCNGASWSGKVFLIIGHEWGVNSIKIKGIEVLGEKPFLLKASAGRFNFSWDNPDGRLWTFPAGTVLYSDGVTPISASTAQQPDVIIPAGGGSVILRSANWNGDYSLNDNGTNEVYVGDFSDLPNLSYYLSLSHCSNITGDLSDLPNLSYKLNLYNGTNITGDLSDLPNLSYYLSLTNCSNITGAMNTTQTSTKIYLTNCSSIDVDQTLINLAVYWDGKTSGVILAMTGCGVPDTGNPAVAAAIVILAAAFTTFSYDT